MTQQPTSQLDVKFQEKYYSLPDRECARKKSWYLLAGVLGCMALMAVVVFSSLVTNFVFLAIVLFAVAIVGFAYFAIRLEGLDDALNDYSSDAAGALADLHRKLEADKELGGVLRQTIRVQGHVTCLQRSTLLSEMNRRQGVKRDNRVLREYGVLCDPDPCPKASVRPKPLGLLGLVSFMHRKGPANNEGDRSRRPRGP